MKNKVLGVSLIAIGLFALLLLTFDWPYKFRQEYDQIVRIEILAKEEFISGYYVPMEVVKTLDISEYRIFLDELMKIEGSRVGLDPPSGFGAYIIRITYRNGEIELISDYNSGYISGDGIVREIYYCMDSDQFYDFLSRVLGEQITEPPFKW